MIRTPKYGTPNFRKLPNQAQQEPSLPKMPSVGQEATGTRPAQSVRDRQLKTPMLLLLG